MINSISKPLCFVESRNIPIELSDHQIYSAVLRQLGATGTLPSDRTFHVLKNQKERLCFAPLCAGFTTFRETCKLFVGEHSREALSGAIERHPVLKLTLFLECNAIPPLVSYAITPSHHCEVGIGLVTRRAHTYTHTLAYTMLISHSLKY
jgi:hypothetical protein